MLSVKGIQACYGNVRALHGVSLEVPDGSVVALLGANGAGKSTTLKTISGILHPAAGEIVFNGRPIGRLSPAEIVRLGIVHCPEGRQVFAHFSVRENLNVGAYARGSRDEIDAVLEIFPALRDRLAQQAGTLSGGEQQMLAIGRCLMGAPDLVMFDEPSLGLAPAVAHAVLAAVRDLNREGLTCMLVEQNVAVSLKLASRAYVLENGRITLSGTGEALLADDRVRQAYLGM